MCEKTLLNLYLDRTIPKSINVKPFTFCPQTDIHLSSRLIPNVMHILPSIIICVWYSRYSKSMIKNIVSMYDTLLVVT